MRPTGDRCGRGFSDIRWLIKQVGGFPSRLQAGFDRTRYKPSVLLGDHGAAPCEAIRSLGVRDNRPDWLAKAWEAPTQTRHRM